MTGITEWIKAHEPGAEFPPFCEHCGQVLELGNDIKTFTCPCSSCHRNKFSHFEYISHVYCKACYDRVVDELHDALATFCVYDPETGQKVKK